MKRKEEEKEDLHAGERRDVVNKASGTAGNTSAGYQRAGATGDDALGAGKTGSSMGVTSNEGGIAGTAGSVNKPNPQGEGRKLPPGSEGGCC
ncbi:MAG: hypothetical protein U0Z53_08020 [Blastocatellia bacterium]